MTTVDEPPQDPFEPIAVIGVAALFPDAPNLDAFWGNILSAKVSLKEVPDGRWDVGDFWVEGGPKNVDENKTYSKIGGWVEDFEFDWSCLLYTSPSPRDKRQSRMPSSA